MVTVTEEFVPAVAAPTGKVRVWPTVTLWGVMLLKTMRPPGGSLPIQPAMVFNSTLVL